MFREFRIVKVGSVCVFPLESKVKKLAVVS